MDHKTFVQRLSRTLGEDQHATSAMIDTFADVLRTAASGRTSVAVPSFGTFMPVKVDEEIVTDRVTGRRMLLPPQITVEFVPAAMLRKRFTEDNE